ncbi:glycosyltransferase family 2 protein [Tropicimonas sp. TH_r6]|uniref:glycosyltransferase family 2 protein n=1 Tax=Tropicimonas sp. TH_r6 TaxID=3082085 RepID=UPI002953886F|nr:glycosyltransferase family 2 protein [Tropicimonas sp. TH_r6]MDV7141399.1 glycosyltransferase family 2 protein [Tropicimonas sp. TH_r6]
MPIEVSVVIPTHNRCDDVEHTIKTLAAIGDFELEIIVVDDASTDRTVPMLEALRSEQRNLKVVTNTRNLGAGRSRNAGFNEVQGQYTIFLDADDLVHPAGLVDMHLAAVTTNADIVLAPFDLSSGVGHPTRDMHGLERRMWARMTELAPDGIFTLGAIPEVMRIANYPWNKLINTRYAQSIGLRFGDTPVHNDVFAHWQTMLQARWIAFTKTNICTHIVPITSGNITNISDKRRLGLFDALEEVEDFFDEKPFLRANYYHHFLSFKVDVLIWASTIIDKAHGADFLYRSKDVLRRVRVSDALRLAEDNPEKAKTFRVLPAILSADLDLA